MFENHELTDNPECAYIRALVALIALIGISSCARASIDDLVIYACILPTLFRRMTVNFSEFPPVNPFQTLT